MKNFVFAATLVLLTGSSLAQEGRFYERKSEGWFFYGPEELITEETPKQPEPTPPPAAPVELPQSTAKFEPPAAFSSAWFRENLPKYRDYAWDNPSVENVRLFLYLQRFAIDRSEQFSNAYELAVVGDPFLDEISRRPTATFASQQMDRQAATARSALLGSVAQRVGIFFFFSSDCEYCEMQAPLVKMLEETGGFSIVPVSLDGKPLPSNLFSDVRTDTGHAEALGVTTLPAVFLASPQGEFEAIGQGLMSLPEMHQRILIAARRNNWVSDDEYNKTRPLHSAHNNLSELVSLPDRPVEASNPTNFIPPEELLSHFGKSFGRTQ